MATTTDKISFGSNTAITCTLTSLASSATAGRGCTAIDNSSNLYVDALLTISIKTSASALANDKACYIYIFGAGADSIYNASSAESVGTDGAVTIDSPTNLLGPVVLACPSTSTTYRAVIPIAQFFGGVMPYKWGFVLRNYTGQNTDSSSSNCFAEYTGVYYTNS